MKYRQLGNSSLCISEIGLDCGRFGDEFHTVSDDVVVETMAEATRAGVCFFDMDENGLGGRGPRLVSEYLYESGATPLIAIRLPGSLAGANTDHSNAHLRAAIEKSIGSLGVDAVDLIQLQDVPTDVLREGTLFQIMADFRREGLCHAWGVVAQTVDDARLCLQQCDIASLQVQMSMLQQQSAWQLFEDAAAACIGILVRVDADTHVGRPVVSEETARALPDPAHDPAGFESGQWNFADSSVRWILDHRAVTAVLASCSSPAQVQTIAHVPMRSPLPVAVQAALDNIYLPQTAADIQDRI